MPYYSPTDDISYVPLTPEDERFLINDFYKGGPDSRRSRDRIIETHLKLVAKLALQKARGGLEEDEAISAGNAGLIQALESRCFDPSFGVRFHTYVRKFVNGQVLSALRMKLSLRHELTNLRFTSPESCMTGREAREQDFRVATNLDKAQGFVQDSVDHPSEENDLAEVRKQQIEKALKQLTKAEAHVVRAHYFGDKTLASAGREIGLGREGARKAHNRGIEKLQAALAEMREELE